MLTLRHDRTDARRWTFRALLAALAAAMLLMTPWSSPSATAHGSTADPVSRNYGCWQRWGNDFQNPAMAQQDPMCWQAWQYDTNAMWNWNGLYREGTNGNYQAFIPDNQLCSAGHTGDGRYNSLDNPGAWRTSSISNNFTVNVLDQAYHGADYLRVYVTRQGYNAQTDALDWGDLELLANTGRYAPAGNYTVNVSAPGRSGHHVVYTVWKASHADQIYFFCSDVTF
ncbi:cellulose-binding protein [Streptomyces sp. 8K308]|uniref:lytic polysaccharide monooxygenase auxiliary activity family 9 protein n=1 Tax=Streptomyces sp. 8K308 TaxID=2530388 RepID=UPI001045004F|nr:lytic polysaccharide monooxygenase auxiliary activity family 9 protein [Streptomyces sp. 8K308]TDC23264.1 cellulose-binding protein [Streptomyces sp. 8K308]